MAKDPFDDGMPLHQRPAIFSSALTQQLLLVANFGATVSEIERSEAAIKVFAAWPKLCRAMARLEELMPGEAEAGQEEDAKMVTYLERRAAKSEGDS